jgi:segregation and condensation protein B
MTQEINIFEVPVKKTEVDSFKEVKQLIEALLFAATEPLSLQKIRDIVEELQPIAPRVLRQVIEELKATCEAERGFQVDEIAEGFVLRTKQAFAPYIGRLQGKRRVDRFSGAAMEVLAIVAYRHPITRAEIDHIRGVDSSGTLHMLVDRELVESVGRKEAPGRPLIYGITKQFMQHFGLRSLKDLPKIQESN